MKQVKLSVLGGVLNIDYLPKGVQILINEHDNEESWVVRWQDGDVVEESRVYNLTDEMTEKEEKETRERLFKIYTTRYQMSEEEAKQSIDIWINAVREVEEESREGLE